MAAHCEACGGHVMPYRRYAFWTRSTACCDECGSPVRLRHFWTVVAMAGVLALPPLGLLALVPTPAGVVATALALTAVIFALDYASYHVLTWELDPAFQGDDELHLLAPPEA